MRSTIVFGDQQSLAVVGELHFGARDFDAGAGARGLLLLGQAKQRFRKLDVGARGFERGLRAKPGEIGARHLIGHLIVRAFVVGLGGFDGDLGSLIAANGAEVEDGLVDGGAGVQDAEGPTKVGMVKPGMRNRLGKSKAEGLQVGGLVLILDVAFKIGKQRGAGLIGSRFGLLQILFGELDAGAAFGRERELNGLFEAELQDRGAVLQLLAESGAAVARRR